MITSRDFGKAIFGCGPCTGLVLLWLALGLPASCLATTVNLQWNADPGAEVAGYRVYYRADAPVAPFDGAGALQGASPVEAASPTSATISGLDPQHAYYFAVTSFNSAGVESSYSNIASIPELSPPAVSISYPASSAKVSGTVSVTASASDNVGVTRLEFYLNGALVASDSASPYLYSWNTSSLAPGAYTLVAKAYDAAGNVGTSGPVSVTVVNDTTAPSVALTAPASGATLSGTVAVAASASDNVGVARVEFYLDGALLCASNVAPYSCTWNTASAAGGTHTLKAKAYDAAGNVGQTADTAVLTGSLADTSAPSVSLAAPGGGATVSGTVALSAAASDNIGVTRVEFYRNGALLATAGAAPFSFSWDTRSVANGSCTLSARAYDAAGNAGVSPSVTVTVNNAVADTAAPTVSLSAPAAGATVSGTAAVSASAADNVGVTRVEFYLNGALLGTATASPYSFSWNTASIANGSCTLSARAYDAAGNVGTSANLTVTVSNSVLDTLAPVIGTFTLPASATSLSVPVTGFAATDNTAVTGYLITSSATPPAAGATGWSASRPASYTFSGYGLRTAYAWAKDAAGNVSACKSASVNIVLADTSAPTITSLSPASGTTVGSSVKISAVAKDNVRVTRMNLYLDGVLKTSKTSSSLGWTWYPTRAAAGAHTISVEAWDAANNKSTRSVTVYR